MRPAGLSRIDTKLYHQLVPTDLSRLRSISSRQNALLKELRRAFHAGEPTEDGYCAIESVKTIEEAIRSGLRLRAVVFAESARSRADRLLPQLSSHVETIITPDDVFSGIVSTDTPQGVAALVRIPEHDLHTILDTEHALVVVAAGLQDPGNLGTVMRSCEAFGAAGLITTEGTASHFNPKVIRASAGSIFRFPVVKITSGELVSSLRGREIPMLATSSHKGTPIDEVDFERTVAIFIGSEGSGLPRALANAMDESIAIPQSGAESLNAGVAASVILYEAARQRRARES